MVSRQNRVRDQASHSRKQQTATPHSVHWWLCPQRPVRVGLHRQARFNYHPWRQCSLYDLNLQLDNGGGNSNPCLPWVASRGHIHITHAIILTDSISLLHKVQSGMGSPDWKVSMIDIHLRNLVWVYCPGHAVVKGNDRTDRLAAKQSSQVACFSENLKCSNA